MMKVYLNHFGTISEGYGYGRNCYSFACGHATCTLACYRSVPQRTCRCVLEHWQNNDPWRFECLHYWQRRVWQLGTIVLHCKVDLSLVNITAL